jgi:RluA family pseudouridine synthase
MKNHKTIKIISSHIVPQGNHKIRLQDYVSKIFNLYIPSKTGIKKAIKQGRVLLDGSMGHTGSWVLPGQHLALLAASTENIKVYIFELKVVFEDELLAVINKPAGLTVSGNTYKTLYNALPHNLAPSSEIDALARPTPVHRLDNQTSGLLLIAKTKTAQIELGKQFENNTIQKFYKTIVTGRVTSNNDINEPIENKIAKTSFEIESVERSLKYQYLSLLTVSPKTGRTHQIRIHLASLGHPILGDKLYTDQKTLLKGKGLFLCASEIVFLHPKTGNYLRFKIDPPKKFDTYLDREKIRWATQTLNIL